MIDVTLKLRFCTGKYALIMGWAAFSLLSALNHSPAAASDGVASNALINRAGLTVEWFTQSGVSAVGEIVDLDININENKATTYFVIEAGNYREVISEHDLNAFGEPYGLDGAVAHIEIRSEVIEAELKSRGKSDVSIEVDQFSLPETTIYILTSDGIVSAIDGDSGKTKWSTQIGSSRLPSIGVGSSNDNVAAVNGSEVYFLEAETGKVLWSQACQNAVGAAPAISPDRVFVPLFDGRLEAFPIKDNGVGSFTFVAYGSGSARPLVTERTVAWPTYNGDLNVAALYGKRNRAVSYRLTSDNSIVSSPTFKSGMLFTSSLDGFVYAIDEKNGSLEWEVSTGEAIAQSPIPLGNRVYAITQDGRLFCLDAKSGRQVWDTPTPKVGQYVGASPDRLYLTDKFGRLIIVDKASGVILNRVDAGDISFILPNYQTDRLYFGSEKGMIQCLREVASKIPYFHADDVEAKAQPAAADMDPEKPVIAAEDDPFRTFGQQQGAPDRKPTAADDPFAIENNAGAGNAGGNAKDAGAGDSDVEDDPFK